MAFCYQRTEKMMAVPLAPAPFVYGPPPTPYHGVHPHITPQGARHPSRPCPMRRVAKFSPYRHRTSPLLAPQLPPVPLRPNWEALASPNCPPPPLHGELQIALFRGSQSPGNTFGVLFELMLDIIGHRSGVPLE
ncbi:hypothetical protein PAPYR_5448 [Paratrimastix pyriformis]|uniref:Uncharacterized protein n=1 Tax=Paratrimastix pyriformis TaxID=342808 RepID=A0ABQ8ULW8_9EUKA|nr:hypothetical protein PAPYR_5448 [Paratrimastix pyriformis]